MTGAVDIRHTIFILTISGVFDILKIAHIFHSNAEKSG